MLRAVPLSYFLGLIVFITSKDTGLGCHFHPVSVRPVGCAPCEASSAPLERQFQLRQGYGYNVNKDEPQDATGYCRWQARPGQVGNVSLTASTSVVSYDDN